MESNEFLLRPQQPPKFTNLGPPFLGLKIKPFMFAMFPLIFSLSQTNDRSWPTRLILIDCIFFFILLHTLIMTVCGSYIGEVVCITNLLFLHFFALPESYISLMILLDLNGLDLCESVIQLFLGSLKCPCIIGWLKTMF